MHVKEMFDLKGKVAFVTGAARGLGFAMAEAVAEQGATTILSDVDEVAVNEACARLRGRGLSAEGLVLDVGELDLLRSTIDRTAAHFGRLDIMIANAGISAGPGPLTERGAMAQFDPVHWDTLLRLNLTSVFITIQAAAAHMRKQKSGRIVVTSSIAGIRAERMVGYAYAATKAAVSNLVRQSAVELATDNVTINAIAPGPFLTDIGQGRMRQADTAKQFAADTLLNRIGLPHEIKGLAALLASPASSYITGAVIPIDGGATAI
ncbi:SDR family NAD(P)-dependent oxidoreductase [Bradyrhizobium vignae]|uniref:Oxidoreductase, short chain dehydrogenase/reductase family protein n=1 Tax=Bradyrhizobium vignae TaxID=1549949 RepID=A0A2U3PUT7_9BRAD|nr:SDR family NAD(P)-dependent oxidoreductase [Bradyrhizobium vignae]SPP92889.1 Oxidoreductase, short chain dehydrogenase/reductase family protein [Bradyrhizobium vignae]